MKFKFVGSLVCTLLIAGLYYGAQAQGIGDRNRAADGGDGRWSIQGRVYLPNGKPASDAKVSISSADSLPVSTVTNLDGVVRYVLQYGSHVRVVGPDQLI